MLGKLLKYEFKSTSRVLWFLYGGLIIVALLLGLIIRANVDLGGLDLMPAGVQSNQTMGIFMTIVTSAFALIYFLLIYAIIITTTIVIIMRFYKNMLGGEGYLMHTLPVKTSSLILSKLITACCWMLIAFAVIVVSTLVLGFSSGIITEMLRNTSLREIIGIIRMSFREIGFSGWSFVVLMLISTVSSIMTYYVSMAIGNLANNHKFLFSILAYVGIGIVLSIVLTITSVVSGMQLTNALEYADTDAFTYEFGRMMNTNVWTAIFTQLAVTVGGFFATNYLLSKKLNLA
ncbi:MAG: hypothetical protein IJS33_04715 [Firmicutes bacterium]|nr:hypothetical protein [Bacillota bacterium]